MFSGGTDKQQWAVIGYKVFKKYEAKNTLFGPLTLKLKL